MMASDVPLVISPGSVENICPLILSEDRLFQYFSYVDGKDLRKLSADYAAIYKHSPALYLSLLKGIAETSPLNQQIYQHPNWIDLPTSSLYSDQSLEAMNGAKIMVNAEPFDPIIEMILRIFPSDVDISCSFHHAIEEIDGIYLTRTCVDRYHGIIGNQRVREANASFRMVFYAIARLYTGLRRIDPCLFGDPGDRSSIQIIRNVLDEVVIKIYDDLNKEKIIHYTSPIPLILSTLSAGWYE